MAQMTVELRFKKAWWIWPAMYLAWPISLFSEWQAERYMNWIAVKGITPYVR